MSNAVTKIDLVGDGKSVQLTFGKFMNKTMTVPIKDIKKASHERSLVETFEEGTMFPITVGSNIYYVKGPGQEAIKNGEVFRAVING